MSGDELTQPRSWYCGSPGAVEMGMCCAGLIWTEILHQIKKCNEGPDTLAEMWMLHQELSKHHDLPAQL